MLYHNELITPNNRHNLIPGTVLRTTKAGGGLPGVTLILGEPARQPHRRVGTWLSRAGKRMDQGMPFTFEYGAAGSHVSFSDFYMGTAICLKDAFIAVTDVGTVRVPVFMSNEMIFPGAYTWLD